MIVSRIALAAIAAALPLAACEVRDETKTETATADPAPGVTREAVQPPAEEPPVTPATYAVIQSQPGPEGAQVDLLKAAVTGDILTVTMRCSSPDTVNSEMFRVADVSVIDDATAQRIGVLKDNAGKPLVSEPTTDGTFINADCEKKPGVIWAKFPAPPPTSKTVSINFPGVAPFDGVTVAR